MDLIVRSHGIIHCLYDETVDLAGVGRPSIMRAAHVEPNNRGDWEADLQPVGGPVLGPFARRSEALAAERAWLERHWLARAAEHPGARRDAGTGRSISRPSIACSGSGERPTH